MPLYTHMQNARHKIGVPQNNNIVRFVHTSCKYTHSGYQPFVWHIFYEYFLQSMDWLFIFLQSVFQEQKDLNCGELKFACFSFYVLRSVCPKNIYYKFMNIFLLEVSSRSFRVSAFPFGAIIHFN